jgi:hypothetical protein
MAHKGSNIAQPLRDVIVRADQAHRLVQFVPDDPHWFYQIGVLGQHYGHVEEIPEPVANQVRGKIHIRSFFFDRMNLREFRNSRYRRHQRPSDLLRQKLAVVDRDFGEGFQRVEIRLLTPGLVGIPIAGNSRGVIFDGWNLVRGIQQMAT